MAVEDSNDPDTCKLIPEAKKNTCEAETNVGVSSATKDEYDELMGRVAGRKDINII